VSNSQTYKLSNHAIGSLVAIGLITHVVQSIKPNNTDHTVHRSNCNAGSTRHKTVHWETFYDFHNRFKYSQGPASFGDFPDLEQYQNKLSLLRKQCKLHSSRWGDLVAHWLVLYTHKEALYQMSSTYLYYLAFWATAARTDRVGVGAVLMFSSVWCIAECLAAAWILTQIWLLTSMWAQVSLEILQPWIRLVTPLKLHHSMFQHCNTLFVSQTVIHVTKTKKDF